MFCKKSNAWVHACNLKFFRTGEFLWNQVTSINILPKIKKGPTEKHFGVFSLIYYESYNFNRKFNPKMDIFRALFSKRSHPSPTSPCCYPVTVAGYASISLNIAEYPENAWINCFDYTRALNMSDHLTFWTGFRRCLRLCQGSEYGTVVYNIYKGTHYATVFRVLNMFEYGSMCLSNAWICLNMP